MSDPATTTSPAVPAVYHQRDNLPMPSAFSNLSSFVDAQRMANLLCSSSLVPEDYRGPDKIGNALIALEIAQRIGASPLAVMQNMHVIQGRPSWSAQFIIAAINASGRFSPLRFHMEDLGDKEIPYEYWDGPKGQRTKRQGKAKVRDARCTAWATERATGERLEGPAVSMEMAVLEGWYTKSDSKWKTMPELMLRYRAAAFFGRLYAPELTMGIPMADEVHDISPEPVPVLVEPPLRVEASFPAPEPKKRGRPAKAAAPAPEPEPSPEPTPEPEPVSEPDPEPEPSAEPAPEQPAPALVKPGSLF